jgi:hypothetical protein
MAKEEGAKIRAAKPVCLQTKALLSGRKSQHKMQIRQKFKGCPEKTDLR